MKRAVAIFTLGGLATLLLNAQFGNILNKKKKPQ